jgi:putative phage-type endonuclease
MSEFLEHRRMGIGGSDAAAILGLSPWKSPMSVWLDKRGLLVEAPDPDGEFLRQLGKDLEPVIADLYERKTGRKLRLPADGFVRDTKCPYLLGSPDRLVVGEARGVELKSQNEFQTGFGEPGTDQVPAHYLIQCAHYMMLTGFHEWDIALLRGTRFDIYTIQRDLEFEASMRARLIEWWEKFIVADIPPDIDGTEAWSLYLPKKYPLNRTPAIEADRASEQLGLQLERGMQLQNAIENKVQDLRNRLKAVIGDADGLEGETWKITWRKNKDGQKVDWEGAFRSLGLEEETVKNIIERFTKPTVGARVFRFAEKGRKNDRAIEFNATGAVQYLIGNGEETPGPTGD